MKNFRGQGQNITFPADAATVSGDLVVKGAMFGVALTSAGVGEELTIRAGGEFSDLPLAASESADLGDPAYWNGAAITAAADDGGDPATDYLKVGVFTQAAVDGDTTCTARLNAAF